MPWLVFWSIRMNSLYVNHWEYYNNNRYPANWVVATIIIMITYFDRHSKFVCKLQTLPTQHWTTSNPLSWLSVNTHTHTHTRTSSAWNWLFAAWMCFRTRSGTNRKTTINCHCEENSVRHRIARSIQWMDGNRQKTFDTRATRSTHTLARIKWTKKYMSMRACGVGVPATTSQTQYIYWKRFRSSGPPETSK